MKNNLTATLDPTRHSKDATEFVNALDREIVGKGDRKVRIRDGQRRIAHEVEARLQREPVRILVVLGEAVHGIDRTKLGERDGARHRVDLGRDG